MSGRSTKDLIRETVENLPADATVEEAMEQLYLLSKIERGIKQAEEGNTLRHEEVRKRMGI